MKEFHRTRKITKHTYTGDKKIKNMDYKGKYKGIGTITGKGHYKDGTSVPAIRIEGLVLRNNGLDIGTSVIVEIFKETIIIKKSHKR